MQRNLDKTQIQFLSTRSRLLCERFTRSLTMCLEHPGDVDAWTLPSFLEVDGDSRGYAVGAMVILVSWKMKVLFQIKVDCHWDMGRVMGYDCLVTWFCCQLTAKPGNKTATLHARIDISMEYIQHYTIQIAHNVYEYFACCFVMLSIQTSLHENDFRISGPLWGEYTSHR